MTINSNVSYQQTIQVTLASYPDTYPSEENFSVNTVALPVLQDGEIKVKHTFLSLDPYMRSQIAGRHVSGSIALNGVMFGEVVGEVVETKSTKFNLGDQVRCMGGWQSVSIQKDSDVFAIGNIEQPSHALSVLGMPGLTAYAGLIWQAQPKAGDVVVIPAATGAVGATVGQLAKANGCTVIGIVGSDEKVDYAIHQLGYDACINRKTQDVEQELDKLCPTGINIYFDLVGGDLLHSVSARLAIGARVILCGMIAETNSAERMAGPSPGMWIKTRAIVYGLVVYDYEPRRQEFIDACSELVNGNKLIMKEDVSVGIESAPAAFSRLMRGENMGKVIVKI